MELQCCSLITETGFDLIQFTANIGIILVGIFAIVFSYFQFIKSIDVEKRRERRIDIRRKLDEFYGPFLQLRKKSDILYNRFQKKFRQDNPNFSTLRYLMEGKTFEGNDKELLKEIIIIGKRCEELIHLKSGLIDDSNLRNKTLPKLTTHFLILRLAFDGTLKEESFRFDDLNFPRDVDNLIEARIKKLEIELKDLSV